MKYSILIGNTIQNIGTRLAKSLSYFGLNTDTCSNSLNVLNEKLSENHYDGLIFFIIKINDSSYSFISELRNKYDNLKIYPIIFTGSEVVRQDLIESGANKCIIMPYTDFGLCGEIICDLFNNNDWSIIPEIAEFLQKKNFNSNMHGFYYLCSAIKIYMHTPEIIRSSVINFYKTIAEEMSSTYSGVERALRTVISDAFRKGVPLNGEIVHRRMKNKDLITLLSAEYKEQKRS